MRKPHERAVDEARDRFGRVDTLINNAGIYIGKPFTEYTLDDYAAITAVNLTGFFHITQLAIAEMVERGSGHVVNVSTSLVDHAGQHAAGGATSPHQGRTRRGQPFPGDRVRLARGARQRGVARGHQDTRPRPCVLQGTRGPAPAGARRRSQPTSSTRSSYLERATFVTGETMHVDGGQAAGG